MRTRGRSFSEKTEKRRCFRNPEATVPHLESPLQVKGKDISAGAPLWRKTHEARTEPRLYLNMNLLLEHKKALLEKCGSPPKVATRHHVNLFSQE